MASYFEENKYSGIGSIELKDCKVRIAYTNSEHKFTKEKFVIVQLDQKKHASEVKQIKGLLTEWVDEVVLKDKDFKHLDQEDIAKNFNISKSEKFPNDNKEWISETGLFIKFLLQGSEYKEKNDGTPRKTFVVCEPKILSINNEDTKFVYPGDKANLKVNLYARLNIKTNTARIFFELVELKITELAPESESRKSSSSKSSIKSFSSLGNKMFTSPVSTPIIDSNEDGDDLIPDCDIDNDILDD